MPTELQEALTALGAGALIPKIIDPKLLEIVRRYSPLITALPTDTGWGSNEYYFNSRTQLPAGGAVNDGGARPVSSSTYVQDGFPVKLYQAVGSVSGFAQATTRLLIGDLLRKETEGAIRGLVYSIDNDLCWGNASATAGTWGELDGLDVQFSTFSGDSQNAIDAAGDEITLGWLDQLIQIVEDNNAAPVIGDDWMFVLSPRAARSFSQALIPQTRGPFNEIQIAPGVIVTAYDGIPLVKSSFLSSRSNQVGTVTTTAGTDGSLAAGTYYYQVGAVIGRFGEICASAEVDVTVDADGTATLAFTPPPAYQGMGAQTYRVFRSTTTGTETLLGVVDANVGFQADGITPIVTTSIVDTGATLIPMNGSTAPATSPTAYYGTNAGVLPRVAPSSDNAGGEDVYLISRDPDNICRPIVRAPQPVPVAATVTAPDTLPFAMVTDTCLAVRAPMFGARLRNALAVLTTDNPTLNFRNVD